MGAYEFTIYSGTIQKYFGIKYGNNQFIYDDSIHIYKPFDGEWRRILAVNSRNARYVRAIIPDNDYTKNKTTITAYVYATLNDTIISDVDRVEMNLVRDSTSSIRYVHLTDRPIVFINDKEYVNGFATNPYSDVYFLYASNEANFGYRCIVPASQF